MEVRLIGSNLSVVPGQSASGTILAQWLEASLWLPHRFTLQLFRDGRIRSHQGPLSATDLLPTGGRIWLIGDETTPAANTHPVRGFTTGQSASIQPSVLFEDEHLIVTDKPAGWLVHADGATDSPVLQAWVADYVRSQGHPSKVFHAHRLDRETTGCVLFAKHPFMARALDALLARRLVHRTYIALVAGQTPLAQGTIDAPIGRDRHLSGRYRVSTTGVPASTQYRRLGTTKDGTVSLVACRLQTGRTHQIRVHLASVGCPLLGDGLYGHPVPARKGNWAGSGQALHAWQLHWLHPYTNESVTVEAPLPQPFADWIQGANETWLQDAIKHWSVKPWP